MIIVPLAVSCQNKLLEVFASLGICFFGACDFVSVLTGKIGSLFSNINLVSELRLF